MLNIDLCDSSYTFSARPLVHDSFKEFNFFKWQQFINVFPTFSFAVH